MRARKIEVLCIGAAILALVVAGFVYTRGLTDWLINDDEEGYLYAAWRVSAGDVAYRDFSTPQLPAFLYPGAVAVRLFGRDPAALRALATAMVLVAGIAVFGAGRRLLGAPAGFAAMSVFLFHEDVARLARSYRPEAFLLAATGTALFVFLRADATRFRAGGGGSTRPALATGRLGYGLASVLLGLGLLTKLFAVLPWAGLLAYVAADAWLGGRSRRGAVGDLAAVLVPGAAVVAAVMGTFLVVAPETLSHVVGHHLAQGAERSSLEVLQRSLVFYRDSYLRGAFLMTLVPLGVVALRRIAGAGGLAVAWQLPTAAVFLVLQRDLFPERHLIVLLPAIVIAVAAAALFVARSSSPGADAGGGEPGEERDPERGVARSRQRFQGWSGPALGASLVAALAIPGVFAALDVARLREDGTAAMAVLVRALTPPDGRFLSDNPGMGFYAGRATTAMGAGISEGAAESGQITAERLFAEPEAANISLVTLNLASQDGALADVVDYEKLQAVLDGGFDKLGHFWRHYQRHEVFLARSAPRLGLHYDWAEIVAAQPAEAAVESAGSTSVDLVMITQEVPDRMLTALLHVVGPDGEVWTTGDSLLANGLHRSSEEFEQDEVVALPLAITVPLGAPAGTYTLRLGLYDPVTGVRLVGERGGFRADAFDVGTVKVVVPREPAGAGLANMGRSGGFSLVAAEVPELVDAGGILTARLVWRADEVPGADYRLVVALVGDADEVVATTEVAPEWPTGQWRRDDVAAVRVSLRVPPEAAGPLALRAHWIEAGQPQDGVTAATVDARPLPPPQTEPSTAARALDARVGPARLVAVEAPETAPEGGELAFTLFWSAPEAIDRPYTVLVHVVNAGGEVVAQADGGPVHGARPTTSWRAGEVVADPRSVALPQDDSGPFTILVGLYDPADPALAPLPAWLDGELTADGRVPVATVTVP